MDYNSMIQIGLYQHCSCRCPGTILVISSYLVKWITISNKKLSNLPFDQNIFLCSKVGPFSRTWMQEHKQSLCRLRVTKQSNRKQEIMWTHDDWVHQHIYRGYSAKGSYPPCLRMADRALLAGYPRYASFNKKHLTILWVSCPTITLKMPTILFRPQCVNLLWPSDVLWR